MKNYFFRISRTDRDAWRGAENVGLENAGLELNGSHSTRFHGLQSNRLYSHDQCNVLNYRYVDSKSWAAPLWFVPFNSNPAFSVASTEVGLASFQHLTGPESVKLRACCYTVSNRASFFNFWLTWVSRVLWIPNFQAFEEWKVSVHTPNQWNSSRVLEWTCRMLCLTLHRHFGDIIQRIYSRMFIPTFSTTINSPGYGVNELTRTASLCIFLFIFLNKTTQYRPIRSLSYRRVSEWVEFNAPPDTI